MSPLRIVVIAVLLYIAFRLITGGKKNRQPRVDKPEGTDSFPVEDVLMEDPICHSLVPMQQAVKLKHRDTTLYFCSQECCNEFIAQQGEHR